MWQCHWVSRVCNGNNQPLQDSVFAMRIAYQVKCTCASCNRNDTCHCLAAHYSYVVVDALAIWVIVSFR